MQQRRGPLLPGPRSRLGSDDPKYGGKGRFLLSARGLVLVVLALLLVLAAYAAVLRATERGRVGGGASAVVSNEVDFHGQKFAVSKEAEAVHAGSGAAASSTAATTTTTSSGSAASAAVVETLADGSLVGYVRVPRLPKGERTADDGKLHIIFSSGCNYFQHWQSELLLASAYLVGQRGRITRIVSGCNDKAAETVEHKEQTFPSGKNDLLVPLSLLNRSVNEDFGLFVTPMFEGARDFPWINKPSSIRYFMDRAGKELARAGETVIAILDPDFVFLRPLTQTGAPASQILVSHGHDTDQGANAPLDVVKKGRPVAQRYGLEGGWVSRTYDLKFITGEEAPVAGTWTAMDAAKWTSVGPPLMLHVDDLSALSVLWEKYMRPVLKTKTDILADMWAYSIGAAQLGLKHTTLDHYMISSWGRHGEAFEWVNKFSSLSCLNPKPMPDAPMQVPVFIHMASNFKAPNPEKGPWMFHKGHVPADILDCDTPLIKESPDELWEMTTGVEEKQRAWVLCHIVSTLNKVLLLYKQKFCPVGFEQRKLVRLIQSKRLDRHCDERKDKWCFPIAQVEDLPLNWREELGHA